MMLGSVEAVPVATANNAQKRPCRLGAVPCRRRTARRNSWLVQKIAKRFRKLRSVPAHDFLALAASLRFATREDRARPRWKRQIVESQFGHGLELLSRILRARQ